eukprot:1149281-Pelagomonas_calceolata.AAC.1
MSLACMWPKEGAQRNCYTSFHSGQLPACLVKERKGKERKGKERKGKERKGKKRTEIALL